jgi:hypothetical protein
VVSITNGFESLTVNEVASNGMGKVSTCNGENVCAEAKNNGKNRHNFTIDNFIRLFIQ